MSNDTQLNIEKATKAKVPFYKRWWFALVLGIFIGGIAMSGDSGESTKKEAGPSDAAVKLGAEKIAEVAAERDELQEKYDSLLLEVESEKAKKAEAAKKAAAKPVTLGAGKFYVGEDIAAGRYVVSTTDSSGNFAVMSEGGFAVFNEILGTESGFAVNNITVDLEEGQTVDISGIQKVTFKAK